MSIESVSFQYQVKIEDVFEDIEAGTFQNGVSKKSGRIFLNSVMAWKHYGREEREDRQSTTR